MEVKESLSTDESMKNIYIYIYIVLVKSDVEFEGVRIRN